MEKIYDLVIVGGGPAGLTAALYASRSKLKVLVIEKEGIGSLLMAHKVDNYPGYPDGLTGKELYEQMKKGALRFGTEFVTDTFLELNIYENPRVIKGINDSYKAKAVILAAGWPKNNAPKLKGEEEFVGKGVSYCATCDGFFTKDRVVALFGNGKEVAEESLFLTKYAKEVLVYTEEDSLNCDEELKEALLSKENVKLITNSKLLEIKGNDFVEKVSVDIGGEEVEVDTEYAFLYLGTKSNKELYTSFAKLDKDGYIITGEDMKCEVEGVYAAGDIRAKEVRQVTTATADGTIAGIEVIKYIMKKRKEENN